MTTSSMSKSYFSFVKAIGEAKSKQEENGIIENELHTLKSKMNQRNVNSTEIREYLIRMVYVEMLGHNASFAYIHAVKLTRASTFIDKRIGYLACSLCLHKDHELMLLLVGGLQTDLQSQNKLEISTALTVSCKLINNDTIPAILPLVNKLLNHNEPNIRKKAIMVMQRFNQLDNSIIESVSDKAKRMLCDKDPSVMNASLHLLSDLIIENQNDYTDSVSSLVNILKQIIEHRLPKNYDYHGIPAPWMQIKILQMLSVLGNANKHASEGMYEVLHEVMRRADIGINVGYSIIYECIRTVTKIYPNTQLLNEAAKCTSRFITSENNNLKYLGINALANIVQINPTIAYKHQMIVIDCLQHKDETLRRKTLDLLYKMTNEKNVNIIVDKLIIALKHAIDPFLKQQLTEKITFLADKFAPDTIWFIDTMSKVFELGSDLVNNQIAHNFIKTLAEGIVYNQEDEESEEDIANYAADFFYQILIQYLNKKRGKISNVLMRIICYILGEYGQFCTGKPIDIEIDENEELIALLPMEIITTLWNVIESQSANLSTRQWAMSATFKLVRYIDEIPTNIKDIVSKYKTSMHSDLVQLSHEFTELCIGQENELMNYVFTESSIIDEINVDSGLTFLDNYVSKQIQQGKREYLPPSDHDTVYDKQIPLIIKNEQVTEQKVENNSDSMEQLHKPIGPWHKNVGKEEPKQPEIVYPEPVKIKVLIEEKKSNEEHKPNDLWNLLAESENIQINKIKKPYKRKMKPRKFNKSQKKSIIAKECVMSVKEEKKQEEQTQTAAQIDVFDFFSDQHVPQTEANQDDDTVDLLDGLFKNVSISISIPTQVMNYGFSAMKQQLGTKITNLPRSHETDQILLNNGILQVSYFKIYESQQSILCVFISNISNKNMSNIEISVKKDCLSCDLQFEFDTLNSIPLPYVKNTNTTRISDIPIGKTVCQMIRFGFANPSQIVMPCNIILSIDNHILSPINLQISDLIRPYVIPTKTFGINWSNLSVGACQMNLNVSNASITLYIDRLTKQFHVYHIETIKNEVIVAGNILSITDANITLPILIHCRYMKNQMQSYSIIIRTPNTNISKLIGIQLKQLLSAMT